MPHIHTGNGEFDLTVAGYIVYGDSTLLIKHKKLPIWTPPSGHVELNQTPLEALYMEVREEAGINEPDLELIETHARPTDFVSSANAVRLPLPFDIETHPIDETHGHINLSYVLRSSTDNIVPGPGESNTFKWLTVDELRTFKETNDSIISSAIFAIEAAGEK